MVQLKIFCLYDGTKAIVTAFGMNCTLSTHTTIFFFTFRTVFNTLHEIFNKFYYKIGFVFDDFA